MKIKYTTERLNSIIDELFPDLEFRKYQKEAIVMILEAFQKDPKSNIILDAPTGSGKSIIALVTSKILSSPYFKKQSYILTSETFLQDQYEESVKQFDFKAPSIKGIDRYNCTINHDKISLGDCKIKRIKGQALRSLHCYSTCPYYSRRDAASKSPIAVLNYNYWIIQQTYVNRTSDHPLFTTRDVTFFDEAHKIVSVVNNHFSPRITENITKKSKVVLEFLASNGLITSTEKASSYKSISRLVTSILAGMDNNDFKNLHELEFLLEDVVQESSKLEGQTNELFGVKKEVSNDHRKAMAAADFIKDVHCKIEDYIEIVGGNHKELLVRTEKENEVAYFCTNESYMMEKQFHKYYNFGVFMSATFLNHDFFVKYSNMKNVQVIKIPSTFDFEKSPIFYSKEFNMSYYEKDKSRPAQAKKINEIVNKYESGIIHTGSYDNARYLKDRINNKKIRYYNNTAEKKELINKLSRDKNFFIAGPSLLEGIDLIGDISRCQIFMKIPFLNLGDRFTKVRFDKNKLWYSWETSLNFVQGIGRSNRFKEDYCDTYILDSSFQRLLQAKMIPDYINERIKII